MLNAIGYRVQNFRNVDDSDWIKLDRVTAFVGRNEAGKTTLLKASRKFNPATPEPDNPQTILKCRGTPLVSLSI
jgi:predicted ATPase